MLGRSSARVLRGAPQRICLPCLRRQLLQPVAARSSSLAALRPALLHTSAAVQDQTHAERSDPPVDASSPSEPSADPLKISRVLNRRDVPKSKKGKGKKRDRVNQGKDRTEKIAEESSSSEARNQDHGQNSSEEGVNFAAGELENHATLSEALSAGKTGPSTEEHSAPSTPRKAVRNTKKTTIRKVALTKGEDAEKKSGGRNEAMKRRSLGKGLRASEKGVAQKGKVGKGKEKEEEENMKKAKSKAKPKTAPGAATEAEEESHKSDLDGVNEYENLSAQELYLTPLDVDQPLVPSLAYGLDRVLFNPGVYHLQDPRTQVFNFDPYLSNVMPVAEFNFNSLGEYITSSRDTALSDLAREHQKTFVGSTSSMTASLSHFHYLLSSWRPINLSLLSRDFPEEFTSFTKLNRLPASIFLRYKDGVYSIDADKEFDSSNILAMLGKSLEKLLTLPTEEYERYRVSNPNQISPEERQQPESYHYTSMGDILMRSQLDAHDSRLPGTGMYDLKTRAVVSIRMDVHEWDKNTGYQIKNNLGHFESFEREYYDMMRSVLLKYSLQARMGRMDGIFVAYHNIERIFGFQYMSIEDMDRAIHGTKDGRRELGDQEFRLSIALLNKVLRQAIEKFPETSMRIQFETRESLCSPWMYIFAEPMTEDEIQAIQDTNKAQVQAFERRVLGLNSEDSTEGTALENALTEEAKAYDAGASDGVVQESATETDVAKGAEGVEAAISAESEQNTASEEVTTRDEAASDDAASERASTEPDVEESLLPEMTEESAAEDTVPGPVAKGQLLADATAPDLVAEDQVIQENAVQEDSAEEQNVRSNSASNPASRPLLALKLFVTNKVDGETVRRPEKFGQDSDWVVSYSIKEVDNPAKATTLFAACRKRRADGFSMAIQDAKGDKIVSYYQKLLRNLSAKGREWRAERDRELERNGKVVLKTDGATQRRWDSDTYLSWLYSRGAKGRSD